MEKYYSIFIIKENGTLEMSTSFSLVHYGSESHAEHELMHAIGIPIGYQYIILPVFISE